MKTRHRVWTIRPGLAVLAFGAFTLIVSLPAIAQISLNYDLSWSTLSSGGGLRTSRNIDYIDVSSPMSGGVSLSANTRIEGGFIPGFAFTSEAEGEGEGLFEGEGLAEGNAEGEGTPEGEGLAEGNAEGEGSPDGEGLAEGNAEGEGSPDGEGLAEGNAEGEGTPDGEGLAEGNAEGEGQPVTTHTADQNGDGVINLTELLRVIQFFNLRGYHCVTPPVSSEDGYLPGAGADQSCAPHASDYNSQDWKISLTELLRLIQFFNLRGYHSCPGEGTEDGFCPGPV